MIHLKRINEWKTTEDAKLDDANLEELEDVFLPIKDLDCEDFKIKVSKFIPECYEIKWRFPINLSLNRGAGSYSENNVINLESIKKHKDKIMFFNKTQEAAHEVLEMLIEMGYEIYYYNVNMDGLSYRFGINIARKSLF